MCISWILAVEFDETIIDSEAKLFALPPPLPNKLTVVIPFFFATLKVFIILVKYVNQCLIPL